VNEKREFPFVVQPLNKQHDRTAFSCGIEALDNYFRTQARQDTDKRVAATFVLVDSQTSDVAGFYTLSATTVPLPELPETIAKRLPRYPLIPAVLIGRMAVDKKHQGKKLGEFLLLDALKRCYDQTKQIGPAAVVVDAKNEGALGFYLKMGFIQFKDDPMRLFLPMKTIGKLF
jgi:GNAT superfamily N-acetyltransferase